MPYPGSYLLQGSRQHDLFFRYNPLLGISSCLVSLQTRDNKIPKEKITGKKDPKETDSRATPKDNGGLSLIGLKTYHKG